MKTTRKLASEKLTSAQDIRHSEKVRDNQCTYSKLEPVSSRQFPIWLPLKLAG